MFETKCPSCGEKNNPLDKSCIACKRRLSRFRLPLYLLIFLLICAALGGLYYKKDVIMQFFEKSKSQSAELETALAKQQEAEAVLKEHLEGQDAELEKVLAEQQEAQAALKEQLKGQDAELEKVLAKQRKAQSVSEELKKEMESKRQKAGKLTKEEVAVLEKQEAIIIQLKEYERKGVLAYKEKEYKLALGLLKEAITILEAAQNNEIITKDNSLLSPRVISRLYFRAAASAQRLKQREAALFYAEKALSIDASILNKGLLISAYVNTGDHSKAFSLIEEELKDDPDSEFWQKQKKFVEEVLAMKKGKKRVKVGQEKKEVVVEAPHANELDRIISSVFQ